MDNKEYGLNIDDDYVRLFQKNLGFGNPLEAEYWFIGNEEKLIKKNTENGYICDEIPLERIINNNLNCSECDNFKRKKHNMFFTKDFYEYEKVEDLHFAYKRMYETTGINLEKLFISELFFLPSENGKSLGKTYGTNEENRKDFYKNNNLNGLLEERIKYLFSLLTEDTQKKVYFYSYGDVEDNFNLLKDILGLGNIENWIEKDKQKGQHCIFFYKGNHITIKNKII